MKCPIALLLAAAVVLGGCASGAHKDNMVAGSAATPGQPAAPVSYGKKFTRTVVVETRGGAATGAMDSSNISNQDFKSAIEATITRSELFRQVGQTAGDYQLTVTITQLSKPSFGASFTVDMEAGWALVRTSDKQVVMRKAIKSTHTATMGDSLVGVTRLRLAVEGAAKNNIDQGLKSIAELSL